MLKYVALCLSAMLVPVCASATVVQQAITATVSGGSTVDTLGIFAKAGTSLAGKPLTIFFQYNTALFPTSLNCGTSCSYYNSTRNNPNVPGSVLITAQIGNVRPVYAPLLNGQVQFQNANPSYPANYVGISSDAAYTGYLGVSVVVGYKNPSSLGASLAPQNPYTTSEGNDDITFYTSKGSYETISFTPTKIVQ